uniref:Uncharacterized protein n=1 Tax=Arundo donax TaxID=35708 RepID=A0A0A9AK29_ARUDO
MFAVQFNLYLSSCRGSR